MTILGAVLRILGVAAVLLVLCFGIIQWEKGEENERYDERQQTARGKGYRFCFWVGIVYFTGVMVYLMNCMEREPAIEGYLLVDFGILLEALAFHFYCIVTHSDLPFAQKRKGTVTAYLGCGAVQFLNLSNAARRYGGWPLTGKGSVKWAYLAVAVTFFLLAASHLVASFWKERE